MVGTGVFKEEGRILRELPLPSPFLWVMGGFLALVVCGKRTFFYFFCTGVKRRGGFSENYLSLPLSVMGYLCFHLVPFFFICFAQELRGGEDSQRTTSPFPFL